MVDVVGRFVKGRAPQLVMAASAGDQRIAHATAIRGCFRRWRAEAWAPPGVMQHVSRLALWRTKFSLPPRNIKHHQTDPW
jgi:hypothetical protein